jgi:hypothetical protein
LGGAVDDDGVEPDEDVAETLAVSEAGCLVVDAAAEVVEQRLRDVRWWAGEDPFRVVVGGGTDGLGERDGGGRVVTGRQHVHDGPADAVDDLDLLLQESVLARHERDSPSAVARSR